MYCTFEYPYHDINNRLYNIIDSDYTETHELKINVKGADFQIFTFTFG